MPNAHKPTCLPIATVHGLSHEGRGVASVNGKTTFISGALSGEKVRFAINRRRGSYDEATLTDLIEASPQRAEPRCPHFGVCGGCSLQHMQHAAQLTLKQNTLLELLAHQAGVTPKHILPPLIGDLWGYRRKARIGIKYVAKKGKVLVGFRERNGRYLADLSHCEVLHPNVGNHLQTFADCLNNLSVREQLPQLEVAVTETTTAVVLRHLVDIPANDLQCLIDFSKQHHWQLYLQPKGADSIHLVHPADHDPLLSYELPAHQLRLQFKPHHFIQINANINQQMIARALHLLDIQPDDSVLDLFCGIGNFSLPMAQRAREVIGVEADQEAVAFAKMNSKNNNLNNTAFFASDLFQIPYNGQWVKRTYDKVLLDPPRAGAQECLGYLRQWQPRRIVYVSCNPATLARDTKAIIGLGYRLTEAGIMDMFPHTQHAEAIALFEGN